MERYESFNWWSKRNLCLQKIRIYNSESKIERLSDLSLENTVYGRIIDGKIAFNKCKHHSKYLYKRGYLYKNNFDSVALTKKNTFTHNFKI